MKRPLQGIALILLGILLSMIEMVGSLWIPSWWFFGLLLGIAGAVIAFLPNRKE